MEDDTRGKAFVWSWIDGNRPEFFSCADAIWSFAELGCEEVRSSQALKDLLSGYDFKLTEKVADMPTAFVATWGHGEPVIGFSCEYDALPGLSQQPADIGQELTKQPVVENAPGHGCGHNLLGTGAAMAAVAVRQWLEKENRPGTVVVFGTPAEELCVGKPFMARQGLFKGLDAVVDWHPWNHNCANYDNMNAYFNIKYHFSGRTAHGNAPWMGKSALDGAMLMGHALEMLREHMPPGNTTVDNTAGANTLNYTFSDVGPEYPNVVPDRSTVWVIGRMVDSRQMKEVIERVHKCAEGAAIATGTTCRVEFITASHEKIPNKVLSTVLYENWKIVHPPVFDETEQNFARTVQQAVGAEPTGIMKDILPFGTGDCVVCDTSEYSWFAPFASIWVAFMPGGIGWHNWQVAASARSPLGKKAMVNAAKVLAAGCVDLFCRPEIIAEAKKELAQRLGGRQYEPLVPDHVSPPVHINRKTMEKYRPLMQEHYQR